MTNLGEASALAGGARHLDVTVNRGLITILSADVVKQANDPNHLLCGLSGWKLNEPRAIPDFKACEGGKQKDPAQCSGGAPAFNKPYYTIYSIVGDKLRLGKDEAPNCGTNQQARTAALKDDIFTRILP